MRTRMMSTRCCCSGGGSCSPDLGQSWSDPLDGTGDFVTNSDYTVSGGLIKPKLITNGGSAKYMPTGTERSFYLGEQVESRYRATINIPASPNPNNWVARLFNSTTTPTGSNSSFFLQLQENSTYFEGFNASGNYNSTARSDGDELLIVIKYEDVGGGDWDVTYELYSNGTRLDQRAGTSITISPGDFPEAEDCDSPFGLEILQETILGSDPLIGTTADDIGWSDMSFDFYDAVFSMLYPDDNPGAGYDWGLDTATAALISPTTTGGVGAISYTVESGSLPAGTSLNSSTGEVSGTPTTAGSGSVTIRATDADGAYVEEVKDWNVNEIVDP